MSSATIKTTRRRANLLRAELEKAREVRAIVPAQDDAQANQARKPQDRPARPALQVIGRSACADGRTAASAAAHWRGWRSGVAG
jgi:hypothetical protein